MAVPATALAAFDAQATKIYELMEAKNHDYGEAWRDMRIASFTDLILVKLARIRQIADQRQDWAAPLCQHLCTLAATSDLGRMRSDTQRSQRELARLPSP